MPRPAKSPRAARPAPSGIAALNSAIWSICDVLRRSKCAGAMQYVPELTWILFLRVLDDQEQASQDEAEAVGAALRAVAASPVPLARLGGAERRQAQGVGSGQARRLFRLRQRRLDPPPKSLAQNAQRDSPPKDHRRSSVGRRASPGRHREEPARRARPGRCAEPARRRRHAYVPVEPGLRGPALEDGRQGQ